MLHSFTFKNFQSFGDYTRVSLELNKKASRTAWERETPSGARLATALAIFGANAAGKTALLKALVFTKWFIHHSFSLDPESPIPLAPNLSAIGEPFEIEMISEDEQGVIWRYELTATATRVIREALFRKQATRFAYVFIREWNESSKDYRVKQQDFGLPATEAKRVRQNASLVSTARQYGVDTTAFSHAIALFVSNISVIGRMEPSEIRARQAAELFARFEPLRQHMVQLLRKWDLGLSDVEIVEEDAVKANGEIEKTWTWVGVHQSKTGAAFRLPRELESSGTQAAFVLLASILTALSTGSTAIVDEMESDLHPMLVLPILDLFASRQTNPEGAQVLFTCHSLPVLDALPKSQVMFVEKNDCESEAYRGDEIAGLRADDNLRVKYESGALGALPRT